MPRGNVFRGIFCLVVIALAASLTGLSQAQSPGDLDFELRLRMEHRTPFPDRDETRGFARVFLNYATELDDHLDMRLSVRDSRLVTDSADTSEVTDEPEVHVLEFSIDDVGQIHPYLDFMAGWDLQFGLSELPTYNRGRIIHSDDWSNLGPATSGGYHFHNEWLDGAIDFNFHHLTFDRDTSSANNEGEHSYGIHIGLNELPFVEASMFLWKYRADQSNEAAAAANGNSDPGSSEEDTYGVAFTVRDGLIPDATLSFEYALQEGRRYNADLDAIQRLDSMYYALEGTYDMPAMDRLWDLELLAGHILATGTSAGASRIEEFRSPFGTPHGTHGITDIVDNSNVKDTYLGFRTTVAGAGVVFTFHELKSDQGEDWGDEVNLVTEHQFGDLGMEVGVANFSSRRGSIESTTFLYAQSEWEF